MPVRHEDLIDPGTGKRVVQVVCEKLAGYSVDYEKKGFRGNRDFKGLVDQKEGGGQA